jgi:hypothetical protein
MRALGQKTKKVTVYDERAAPSVAIRSAKIFATSPASMVHPLIGSIPMTVMPLVFNA